MHVHFIFAVGYVMLLFICIYVFYDVLAVHITFDLLFRFQTGKHVRLLALYCGSVAYIRISVALKRFANAQHALHCWCSGFACHQLHCKMSLSACFLDVHYPHHISALALSSAASLVLFAALFVFVLFGIHRLFLD